jgi:hypothetical protein
MAKPGAMTNTTRLKLLVTAAFWFLAEARATDLEANVPA